MKARPPNVAYAIEVGVFLIHLWLEPFGLFYLGIISETVITSDTRQDFFNTGQSARPI